MMARVCGGRVRPFRYRYRISVSVTITESGTVKVLNGTQYIQYPIPTSTCRYQLLDVGIDFRYRYLIPTSVNGYCWMLVRDIDIRTDTDTDIEFNLNV